MTTTTANLTKRVGQRVLLTGGKFHSAGRITKINPKNVLVTLEGSSQRVNAHPSFLSDLAEGAEVPSRYGTVIEQYADVPTQHPGSLVRVDGLPGVYVVIADKFDKINVARLGGDAGRYYRPLRKSVKPLDVAEVTAIKVVTG